MEVGSYNSQPASDDAEEKILQQRLNAAKRVKEDEYRRKWSPRRQRAADVIESMQFELLMGMLLCFNFVVVVLESDKTAKCVHAMRDTKYCNKEETFFVTNMALLIIYCIEIATRAAIWQHDFCKTSWNVFDAVIVVASLAETIIQVMGIPLPSMQFLRVFRLMRLVRTVRLLEIFPELYIMVQGFASAMAAMWWGFLLISMTIIAWSILAVELVNPAMANFTHSTEYCEEAFSSVYNAFLLFFQTLVAGDSWGVCILPILQGAPYFGFIFVGAMVCIQLGFTNLVLSVIVDAASKERDKEERLQARLKKEQEVQAKDTLMKMFIEMDRDNTGNISLEEFVEGYERDREMRRHLAILRIGREDLDAVFALVDEDNSGTLDVGEFCRFIAGVQESDDRVSIMTLKVQTGRVLSKVEAILSTMESVAVVSGAALLPARTNRKKPCRRTRLSPSGPRAISVVVSTESLRKPSPKANMATASRTSASLCKANGKSTSPTLTTQPCEAAAKGDGENREVPTVIVADLQCAASCSTATAGAPAAVNPDIVPPSGTSPWEPMLEADIANRTPLISHRKCGSTVSSSPRGIPGGDPPFKGDAHVVVEHIIDTPRTPPGRTSSEGMAPACSTAPANTVAPR